MLLSSLLLAVNLAKEVKWRGSSIVANKKEVPLFSSQLLLPYTLHPLIGRQSSKILGAPCGLWVQPRNVGFSSVWA